MSNDPPHPRRGANPTIYDIAALVGVSASSVSRALTTPGRLNSKTEARIRAVAAELGYRPNPAARALPTGRSGSIGLVLPDLNDPLWSGLVVAAEAAAAATGRSLLVADAERSPGPETTAQLAEATDGIVLVDSLLGDAEIQHLAATHPTISVARAVPNVRSVLPDLSPGIDSAFDHLIDLGHQSIAYFTMSTGSRMRAATAKAITARAIERAIRVETIPITAEHLDGALARLRATGITAVITQNDLLGIAVAHAAHDRRAVAPSNLSVIGVDDLYVSALVSPALSTIRVPLPELVDRAVRSVLTSNGTTVDNLPPLTAQYVPRESVLRSAHPSIEKVLVRATDR